MRRNFAVSDTNVFKQKVLNWLKQFSTFCFLDSSQYQNGYDLIVGAGVSESFNSSTPDALDNFQLFINKKARWLFGHLGYELATSEKISHSYKNDQLFFPDLFFFEPEILLTLKHGEVIIEATDTEEIFNNIQQTVPPESKYEQQFQQIESKISRNEYLSILNQLKQHLQRGDCYEINFCQEFFVKNVLADPFSLFNKLCEKSPNPFSGLYRIDDKWLLCASPERFIKKEKDQIISQPIKGTLQRHQNNDPEKERVALLQSEKDRAENVMVVDLVRNDLSRICEEGSVKVDELFGIYSFPQVHQMISTVSGRLKREVKFKDIINATFPMGSMTGAPKVKVMQLIDQYEKSKRGIFSGALGYINADGDFDFNVVIRSMMYNQSTQYLSFQAGGGITIYSDAEKEWEESLLKAKAIKEILES
ncbi:anthranilate synthase component I family protein [Niabella ginsengisoli]|uniref:Anthranilate synthase component I family protein n=1 Tax=Niabella ginsengisoli TaxID=522298 RepID=A0ABS9SE11_9BACT|nr:anthranilate synthase component I family protein [Niabella ginsengisoli]MCH5596602.1 anthranilate synthase component I family protein [Niabella ginsengisoli]